MVLDEQVKHLDSQSLTNLGAWLARRRKNCRIKRAEAEQWLRESGVDEVVLRAQWAAQVVSQTRPLPRMSPPLYVTAVLTHRCRSPPQCCTRCY